MKRLGKNLCFIFLMTMQCVWITNGQWIQADVSGGGATILKLASHNGTIFAGEFKGVYASTDSGNHWNLLASSPGFVSSFAFMGSKTIAGVNPYGVYIVTEDGTWTHNPLNGLTNARITSLAVNGIMLFAGTVPCEGRYCDQLSGAVYVSADSGASWTISGLVGQTVNDLLVKDGIIYACTGNGLYRSLDNGGNWEPVINDRALSRIVLSGTTFLAANANKIYVSTTVGASWVTAATLSSLTTITSLAFDGTDMYAATDSGVFVSTNSGTTWTASNSGLTNRNVRSLVMHDGQLYAGTLGRGIYFFNKSTGTWTLLGKGMTTIPGYVTAFVKIGETLVAGSYAGGDGIYLSTDAGKSWSYANQPFSYVTSLGVYDTHVFAGSMQGVYRSDDTCKSWVPMLTSGNYGYQFLGTAGGFLYAFNYYGEMLMSVDDGLNWKRVGPFGYGERVNAFTTIGRTVFLASNGGAWRSADDGFSWYPINDGILPADGLVLNDLTAIGGDLYLGGNFFGIYKSSNNGDSWKKITNSLPSYLGTSFVTDGGSNIFVATMFSGIFHSSGSDSLWTKVDSTSSTQVHSLFLHDKKLFTGTSQGIFYRPLSEITSVEKERGDVPREYTLDQNYPNPFNPSTTISFILPSRSFVTIKIFDMMGREVAVLVSESLPAGAYSRQWNAGTHSSGVYYYRLQAGSFTEAKRLLLLK